MTTKSKNSLIHINSSEFEKLSVKSVCLRVDDPSLLEKSKNLLGENPVADQHGKGPFAYEGLKSSNGGVFVGTSVADKTKGIVLFSRQGISVLESQLAQKSDFVLVGKAQKIEGISYLNLPDALRQLAKLDVRHQYLRDLCSNMLSQGSKIKISFNDRKKSIEIGSKGGKLLTLSIEDVFNTSGVKESMLVSKVVCVDCQASNTFEATKATGNFSLQCSLAKQITSLLDPILDKEYLLHKVVNMCSNYYTENILISKRDRTTLTDLHPKVKFLKSGLNSCLNNLTVLDPACQQQYFVVVEEFLIHLKSLSLSEKAPLTMVETISQTLAKESVPMEMPKKTRRTAKGGSV